MSDFFKSIIDFIRSFLNSSDFSISFYSNFISDLIIALGIGLLLTNWISRKINEIEKKQQNVEKQMEETQKTIQLINVLETQSIDFIPQVRNWISLFVKSAEKRQFTEPLEISSIPRFNISFWELYQREGELPKYLSSDLIKILCNFYGPLVDARRSIDWAYENWEITRGTNVDMKYSSITHSYNPSVSDVFILNREKLKIYAELTCESLVIANRAYDELANTLCTEKSRLISELENLEKYGAKSFPKKQRVKFFKLFRKIRLFINR